MYCSTTAGFLALVYFGMMFYVTLFGLQQSKELQQSWLVTFTIWLLAEIFISSTLFVLIARFFIPGSVKKDIQRVKQMFIGKLDSGRELQIDAEDDFNLAEHLFVSYALAKR